MSPYVSATFYLLAVLFRAIGRVLGVVMLREVLLICIWPRPQAENVVKQIC